MFNNINITTEFNSRNSGAQPKKIPQKNKSWNQQTSDDVDGNLHQDNQPTSEYNSPSHVLQNHHQEQSQFDDDNTLFSQQDDCPEYRGNDIISLPYDPEFISSTSLDALCNTGLFISTEDIVSGNYASKILDHGGAAAGAADIRNYTSYVSSNNNFSTSASLSSPVLSSPKSNLLNNIVSLNNNGGSRFSPDQGGHKSRQLVGGYDAENYNVQSPLRSPRRQLTPLHHQRTNNNSSCLSKHSMYGGGISKSLLGSGHRSGLLDSSHRNHLSPSFDDDTQEVYVPLKLAGIFKEEDSTTELFLSNSGYEKKRKRKKKKSSATDACRKEEPVQDTTSIPFTPSTCAPTIESIIHDCGPSAGIAKVMTYVHDEACRGEDQLMGAFKWLLEGVVCYRELQNDMSREQKINYLLHTDQQYLAKIVTIMSTIHGGFYEDKLNMGPPLSIFHIAIGILHYNTYDALLLQTEEDKKNHNGCLTTDGCVAVVAQMFPRVLDALTNPHLLSGEESNIDVTDMSIAGNRLAIFDKLFVALPNEAEVNGKMRTMNQTDKNNATKTVMKHCNLRSVDELLSVTFGRLILRLELCKAANDKSASVLTFGGMADKYMHESVLTTGMGTHHLTLQRGAHHPQNFISGTIATALPGEKRKQDISICSFLSPVVPFLTLGEVHGIATHWDELKPEEVDAIREKRSKNAKKRSKVRKTGWQLYKEMTDDVVPLEMGEEELIHLVGRDCKCGSWVNHKSGPKAANRSVQIAAIEAFYRNIVEKKLNKPAWKLYNKMTSGELPPNMSDDMIMSLAGNDCNDTAWVAHKSSQEAVGRDVMIAAVEKAQGEVVERRRELAEKERDKAEEKSLVIALKEEKKQEEKAKKARVKAEEKAKKDRTKKEENNQRALQLQLENVNFPFQVKMPAGVVEGQQVQVPHPQAGHLKAEKARIKAEKKKEKSLEEERRRAAAEKKRKRLAAEKERIDQERAAEEKRLEQEKQAAEKRRLQLKQAVKDGILVLSRSDSKTGYTGVTESPRKDRATGTYTVVYVATYKSRYLGQFESKEDAAMEYALASFNAVN